MIAFQEWDSEILGVKCGRVDLPNFERKHDYGFLYARVPATSHEVLRDFRYIGFRIVGIHQELSRDLEEFPPDISPSIFPGPAACQYAKKQDAEALAEMAGSLFKYDRFHADPKIPKVVADRYKAAWGRSACTGYADTTYLITDIWGIVGFVATRKNWLYFIGVREDRQRHGLGRTLVELACKEISNQGYGVIRTATQGGNVPALNMYTKANFTIDSTHVDMHWTKDSAF